MEYFAEKGQEGFKALHAEVQAGQNKAVIEFWRQHYRQGGLCAVCGNTGEIETHPRAGAIKTLPCFCPNGQAERAEDERAG